MFGGTFAPRGWAFCDGQLVSISENPALFSLLGTTYGGDGRTTFGLPDLRGRVPLHAGQGPGLADRRLGHQGGVEQVTLSTNQMPAHQHTAQVNCNEGAGDSASPRGNVCSADASGMTASYHTTPNTQMNPEAVTVATAGGSHPHDNMPPYQAVNFIIALVGIYPSRP
jgi:microcystin-dependent protein